MAVLAERRAIPLFVINVHVAAVSSPSGTSANYPQSATLPHTHSFSHKESVMARMCVQCTATYNNVPFWEQHRIQTLQMHLNSPMLICTVIIRVVIMHFDIVS
jgi:hypothetical protein